MIRGKDMAGAGMTMNSGAAVSDADVADQAKLGRIKTGWFDGACCEVTKRQALGPIALRAVCPHHDLQPAPPPPPPPPPPHPRHV